MRADRCTLGNDDLPVQVVAVEYQGTTVRVALRGGGGAELLAQVPDQDFNAAPVEPGSATCLRWSRSDERPLRH